MHVQMQFVRNVYCNLQLLVEEIMKIDRQIKLVRVDTIIEKYIHQKTHTCSGAIPFETKREENTKLFA